MKELETICCLEVKDIYVKPDLVQNYKFKGDIIKLDANCKIYNNFLLKNEINPNPELDEKYKTNLDIIGTEVKPKIDKQHHYIQSKIDIKLKRDVSYESKLKTNKSVYKRDINLETYNNHFLKASVCIKEDPNKSGNSDETASNIISEGNVISTSCEIDFDIKREIDVKSEPEDEYVEAVAITETNYPFGQYPEQSKVDNDNFVDNGRKRLFFHIQNSGCPMGKVKKLKVGDEKDFATDEVHSERMGKSRRKSEPLNQLGEEEEEKPADEAGKKMEYEANGRVKLHVESAHCGILKKLSQADGYYKCSYCDYETDRRFRLKAHLLKHEAKDETEPTSSHYSSVKKYKCSECDFETMYNANLKVHYARKHSGTSRFRCSVCHYGTYFKSRLKAHMLIHARDGITFACNESGEHGRSEEPVKAMKKYQRTCNKKLRCSECEFETTSNQLYEAHSKCHSRVISSSSMACTTSSLYKCSECTFQTHIKGNLKRHLVTHLDSKLFKCSKCLFETNYRFVLKRHTCSGKSQTGNDERDTVAAESTEMPSFTCYKCTFQSSNNADMKRHYSLMHSNVVDVEEEIIIENSKQSESRDLAAKAPPSIPIDDVRDDVTYVDKLFRGNISVNENPFNDATHGCTVQYHELKALEATGQEYAISVSNLQQNFDSMHTAYTEQHRVKDFAVDEGKVSEYNEKRWEFLCCYCKYKTYHLDTLKTHHLTHELKNFSLVESESTNGALEESFEAGAYLRQNERETDIIKLPAITSAFENGEVTYWLPEAVERSFELSFNKF